LIDNNDKKFINCDNQLKNIFNLERISISDIITNLKQHLVLPNPIEINYDVSFKTDKYDIETDVHHEGSELYQKIEYETQIKELNNEIMESLMRFNKLKNRKNNFMEFSENPIVFINRKIESLTNDLKIIHNRTEEESRKSNFYYHPQINDAIQKYFEKNKTE
jgi:SWI/SNF-related matrix-associated actin-dependent regulator of chromatin subfamily D